MLELKYRNSIFHWNMELLTCLHAAACLFSAPALISLFMDHLPRGGLSPRLGCLEATSEQGIKTYWNSPEDGKVLLQDAQVPLTDYSNAKSNAGIGIKSFWYMQLVLVRLFWLLALLVSQKPATHVLQFLLPSFAKWSINQLCPCTFAEETIPADFSTVNTTKHAYALLQDGLLLSFLSSDGFSPPPEQPSTTQR